MLSLLQIKYIHQCENTDHVYAIVKTSLRVTHMLRVGGLVPAGTMLVTPALVIILCLWDEGCVVLCVIGFLYLKKNVDGFTCLPPLWRVVAWIQSLQVWIITKRIKQDPRKLTETLELLIVDQKRKVNIKASDNMSVETNLCEELHASSLGFIQQDNSIITWKCMNVNDYQQASKLVQLNAVNTDELKLRTGTNQAALKTGENTWGIIRYMTWLLNAVTSGVWLKIMLHSPPRQKFSKWHNQSILSPYLSRGLWIWVGQRKGTFWGDFTDLSVTCQRYYSQPSRSPWC